MNMLRPDTAALWRALEDEPLLNGFVLIGGTALALRIGHRISEDLDLAYLGPSLPKPRIKALIRKLEAKGFRLQPNQNIVAEQDFIDAGLALEDSQQDYLAEGALGQVKLSFVRLENAMTAVFSGDAQSPLRIATLDEIFASKTLVSAERSKTRDWFDLYVLLTQHGYSMLDFHRVFMQSHNPNGFDIASARLRRCMPSIADEGYLQLASTAPSLDELRTFFSAQLDALEIEVSRKAFKRKSEAPK